MSSASASVAETAAHLDGGRAPVGVLGQGEGVARPVERRRAVGVGGGPRLGRGRPVRPVAQDRDHPHRVFRAPGQGNRVVGPGDLRLPVRPGRSSASPTSTAPCSRWRRSPAFQRTESTPTPIFSVTPPTWSGAGVLLVTAREDSPPASLPARSWTGLVVIPRVRSPCAPLTVGEGSSPSGRGSARVHRRRDRVMSSPLRPLTARSWMGVAHVVDRHRLTVGDMAVGTEFTLVVSCRADVLLARRGRTARRRHPPPPAPSPHMGPAPRRRSAPASPRSPPPRPATAPSCPWCW